MSLPAYSVAFPASNGRPSSSGSPHLTNPAPAPVQVPSKSSRLPDYSIQARPVVAPSTPSSPARPIPSSPASGPWSQPDIQKLHRTIKISGGVEWPVPAKVNWEEVAKTLRKSVNDCRRNYAILFNEHNVTRAVTLSEADARASRPLSQPLRKPPTPKAQKALPLTKNSLEVKLGLTSFHPPLATYHSQTSASDSEVSSTSSSCSKPLQTDTHASSSPALLYPCLSAQNRKKLGISARRGEARRPLPVRDSLTDSENEQRGNSVSPLSTSPLLLPSLPKVTSHADRNSSWIDMELEEGEIPSSPKKGTRESHPGSPSLEDKEDSSSDGELIISKVSSTNSLHIRKALPPEEPEKLDPFVPLPTRSSPSPSPSPAKLLNMSHIMTNAVYHRLRPSTHKTSVNTLISPSKSSNSALSIKPPVPIHKPPSKPVPATTHLAAPIPQSIFSDFPSKSFSSKNTSLPNKRPSANGKAPQPAILVPSPDQSDSALGKFTEFQLAAGSCSDFLKRTWTQTLGTTLATTPLPTKVAKLLDSSISRSTSQYHAQPKPQQHPGLSTPSWSSSATTFIPRGNVIIPQDPTAVRDAPPHVSSSTTFGTPTTVCTADSPFTPQPIRTVQTASFFSSTSQPHNTQANQNGGERKGGIADGAIIVGESSMGSLTVSSHATTPQATLERSKRNKKRKRFSNKEAATSYQIWIRERMKDVEIQTEFVDVAKEIDGQGTVSDAAPVSGGLVAENKQSFRSEGVGPSEAGEGPEMMAVIEDDPLDEHPGTTLSNLAHALDGMMGGMKAAESLLKSIMERMKDLED
ncbi:hypothetical protein T439DRAFT_364019 [Meredithblackwellia eburnea MCA 4105]